MRTPFALAALLLSSPALSADCSDFFQSVSFGNIVRLNASEHPQQCVNTLSSNGKTAVYIATENDDPAMIAWLVKQIAHRLPIRRLNKPEKKARIKTESGLI
ncbi:hypothetical protein [Vibrio coralliilyticus]|uniref:hypothetical protein n=1 Tax=Vibrio coralliilyticus TaxID=190893 RepID=UPI002FD24598